MTAELGSARPLGWSEPGRTTLEIKTGGWRTRRPVYVEAMAPCRAACPAGEPVSRWIELARLGDYAGAWRLIREDNPFPAIMGRVCAHSCERACNRGQHDGAVAINVLERFVGDWGIEHGAPVEPPPLRSERVAVIGGGPAGLACAYHLRRLGHPVHLFEAEAELGGLMRYGIPEYRLPRGVLDREIALAIGPGVEVFTGRRLGESLSWATLGGYDAVFVATGAPTPLGLGVPGEAARGVDNGLAFLRAINSGARPEIGSKLAVVGGGSTAMDVARCARRLGVPSVMVLALESREEMPATPEEVTEALSEDVTIVNGVGVSALLETHGTVTGVLTSPATIQRGNGGAIRPRLLPGPLVEFEVDRVLLAIGQTAELSAIPADIAREHGIVAVDRNGATSCGRVFAGGDAASARRTVTDAIGAGTRAARAIHVALSGQSLERRQPSPSWSADAPGHVVDFSEINVAYFRSLRRAGRRERSASSRMTSFEEAVGGLDEAAARLEMERCFTCGHCIGCDNCYLFCPDMAIARVNGGYRISAEHCKGCALCVEECPRGALQMVNER
jgi:NADPH-dependent glutamate synthase beta subunit-like oxidoreductase